MLKLLTTALISLSILGCAMTEPVTEEEREQAFVVAVENKSQKEIIDAARIWIAQNYTSAKAVTEYSEDLRIIGNGSGNYPCSGLGCIGKENWKYHYTMTIDAKDNKYRIVFTNIGISFPASYASNIALPSYNGPIRNQKELTDLKPVLAEISEGIKLSINKKINIDDNW